MQQVFGAQAFFKNAQQVQLVLEEELRVCHVDPALHQFIALGHGLGQLEDAEKTGFALGMAGFKFGQEDAGQFADAGGHAEIFLHEYLHRPPAAKVAIAHPACHLDLQVKGQDVAGAFGDVVKMAAHGP